MLQSNGQKESNDFTVGQQEELQSVLDTFGIKKIPVLYGNIIFQEHPEGPAVVNKAVCYHYVPFSKQRLEVIRLCPNSSI